MAKYLIGGNVMEALLVFNCCIQQYLCADDIGFDEFGRAGDGAVNVGFGREVDNRVCLPNQILDDFRINDISLDKFIPRIIFDIFQII